MKDRRKTTVSVIVVTYKEREELLEGLTALYASNKDKEAVSMEVIVVDNDRDSKLRTILKKNFPTLRYKNTGANIGFGAANNVGAALAHGQYLFFLNPDTSICRGAVAKLAQFLDKHPNAAVVAPALLDTHNRPYADQGSAELTPLAAFGSHSIFTRIWPGNPIANAYWLRRRNHNKAQKLAVIPGTAMMFRANAFKEVGGFDPRFFIYFEEHDICRRLRMNGWDVWWLPQANVQHIWHAATQASVYKQVYLNSREEYFKKYYGFTVAGFTKMILNLNKFGLIFIYCSLLVIIAIVIFNR